MDAEPTISAEEAAKRILDYYDGPKADTLDSVVVARAYLELKAEYERTQATMQREFDRAESLKDENEIVRWLHVEAHENYVWEARKGHYWFQRAEKAEASLAVSEERVRKLERVVKEMAQSIPVGHALIVEPEEIDNG